MTLKKIKAILFDLDGTLIDVDLKGFIPSYMELLSEKFKHLIRPSKFISLLLEASNQIDQNDGKMTNEEIFEHIFFPLNGHSREEVDYLFDDFYNTEFIKLKIYTKIKQDARSVVSKAFESGYDVVIATTPVIPLTAIQQRLDWAGVGDFNYKFITTIENMRANKPNKIYFTQIFNMLGVKPSECLMVGDENKDMVASKFGCETFLVPSNNTNLESTTPTPTYQGELKDLLPLL
jgi:FMN phosphatase YigB (HAD superfamily)